MTLVVPTSEIGKRMLKTSMRLQRENMYTHPQQTPQLQSPRPTTEMQYAELGLIQGVWEGRHCCTVDYVNQTGKVLYFYNATGKLIELEPYPITSDSLIIVTHSQTKKGFERFGTVKKISSITYENFLTDDELKVKFFLSHDACVDHYRELEIAQKTLASSVPTFKVTVPTNVMFDEVFFQHLGITYSIPTLKSDQVQVPVVSIISRGNVVGKQVNLRPLIDKGYGFFKIDDTYVPYGASSNEIRQAIVEVSVAKEQSILTIVEHHTRELKATISKNKERVADLKFEIQTLKDKLSAYKQQETERVLQLQYSENMERERFKSIEQIEKTRRAHIGVQEASVKSSSSTLSTALSIGAGIAAVVAIIVPLLGFLKPAAALMGLFGFI